jgi:O-antigen ligase
MRRRPDFWQVDTFAGVQIFIVCAACVVLVCSAHLRQMFRALRGRPAVALLAYYVFAALSAVWSPHMEYSLYMAGEALVLSVLTLTLMSQVPSRTGGERVCLAMIAVIMMVLYVPRAMAKGTIMVHTNQYTVCAMMLFCYAFAEYHNAKGARRIWLLVCWGAGLLGLIAGTSTGSNIAAVMGVLSLSLVRADLRHRTVLVALCLGVVIFVAGLSIQGVGDIFAPGKGWEGVATGQNRMPLWEVIVGGVKEHPLLGFGFGVGTKVYSATAVNRYITGAHNTILEVLISTGVVGLSVFLIGVAHVLSASYREVLCMRPGSAGVFAATVGAFVNSLSGVPVYGGIWAPVAFAFFFMYGFFEFNVRGTDGNMQGCNSPIPRSHCVDTYRAYMRK